MDRRDFLKVAGGAMLVGSVEPTSIVSAARRKNAVIYGGWIPNRNAVRAWAATQSKPYFSQRAAHIKGYGEGKRVFLWKYLERVTNTLTQPHDQTIGDCVSQGWGLGIDVLTAVQIHVHKKSEKWVAKAATEPIYAGSRIEVGNGKIRIRDGSHGVWAARFVREWGVLHRLPYFNGKYDFTTYSGTKARRWAHKCKKCTTWGGGVPDELETVARRHPVRTTALVTTWNQACDAVANGYPVIICSNQGFTETRDNQGFATADGTWLHCMLLAGIDTISRRPGGLLINSWGPDWITGPTRYGQPAGSFWAEAETIHDMLQEEDSFAISHYKGYPRQRYLDYQLY